MTAISGEHRDVHVTRPPHPRGFRGDIQGLRAIAVLVVVLYHAEVFGLTAGFVGVDVFFVISGYLITRHLANEIGVHGRPQLAAFYANRVRRLVPAATVTLLGTTLLTVVALPVRRWDGIGQDVVGSALYYENWLLAHTAVNYLAQDEAASPLQHFWSLSVEEQFYLGWPVALAVLALLLRGRGTGRLLSAARFGLSTPRAAVLWSALLIGLPSLAFSVVFTTVSPGQAYFVTPTRLWELAAGGLLTAVAPLMTRLGRAVNDTVTWVGLGTILVAAVAISPGEPYPGTAALLPVVGAMMVIAGGEAGGARGAELLLGRRPLRFLGDVSYSLYLWHWPVLVVARALCDRLTPLVSTAAIALAVVLSYLSYRFVENPFRNAASLRTSKRAVTVVGVVCIVVSLLAALLLRHSFATARTEVEADQARAGAPAGAAALLALPSPRDFVVPATVDRVSPDPILAADDWPGCETAAVRDSAVRRCDYGDLTSDVGIALVGDSHAKQWIPALQAEAQARHWHFTAYIHDACPFATGPLLRGKDLVPEGTEYTSCMQWNAAMQQVLAADRTLRLVLTSNYGPSAYVARDGARSDAATAEALRAAWAPLAARDVPVLVLHDTPAPLLNIPDCVARHRHDLTACAVPTTEATRESGRIQVLAAQGIRGVTLLDVNTMICPGAVCPPVIGDVLVYRDGNHLTSTYVETLRPFIAAGIDAAMRSTTTSS